MEDLDLIARVEARVPSCPQCRQPINLDEKWLDDGWAAIVERVESAAPTNAFRLLLIRSWSTPISVFKPAARGCFLILMAVAGLVLARRHDLYRRGEA